MDLSLLGFMVFFFFLRLFLLALFVNSLFSAKPLDGNIILGSDFGSSPRQLLKFCLLLILPLLNYMHFPNYAPLSQTPVPLCTLILLDSFHLANFHWLGKIWLEPHLLCDPSLTCTLRSMSVGYFLVVPNTHL